MNQNILKTTDVTKIFLRFTDGKKIQRKELVTLRYMDSNSCYFSGSTPINFTKPKWRTKADIIVYTPDGIYSANVIIRDTDFSLSNISYKLDIPKTWKFTQLRAGSRKKIELPLTLKFNDGLEISTKTFDLSVGGFSFISAQELNTTQRRFACNCKIQFPNDSIINFPAGLLEVDSSYVRQKPNIEGCSLENEKLLCFKFANLSQDQAMILKNFLMKQD